MPSYDFKCDSCGTTCEQEASMTETLQVTCPCGTVMRKLFAAPALFLGGRDTSGA